MSAPPSPRTATLALGKVQFKKRDRPPALDILEKEAKAASDSDALYERAKFSVEPAPVAQPSLLVSPATEDPSIERDYPTSRSASATSSLDPYYFGKQSPTDSPIPPLPHISSTNLSVTPENRSPNEPVTPARDPASIDRRGLVGVGELTTPRWVKTERDNEEHIPSMPYDDGEGSYDVIVPEDVEQDDCDSPWTIEAIDGEGSEREDIQDLKSPQPQRTLRSRRSADESGGEEILYPRKVTGPVPEIPYRAPPEPLESTPSMPTPDNSVLGPASPPSAFASPIRRAKKRTSDEFEMDHSGILVTKQQGAKEKPSARKHRSMGGSISSSSSRDGKLNDRRSRDSVGLTINSSLKSTPRHSRQTSSSSARAHATDFSHLPPSPSSSSIQQFLGRNTGSSPLTPPLGSSKELPQASPNVAHSLLRGTQEGWSALDDESAAGALRKLDGLSGKSARARASIGSVHSRPLSLSRPATPPSKSGSSQQWEGIEAVKPVRRGSLRDSHAKAKDKDPFVSPVLAAVDSSAPPLRMPDSSDLHGSAVSSDEQGALAEKTPKKGTSSARSSFAAKRGSASSTTYAGTPTTTTSSSRDSASMSAATSLTSVSRHSARRRDSAGSDISSIHSSDATSLKDRVASLAINGDGSEDVVVPPVPPLPKDLSTYRSPPATAVGMSFPQAAIPEGTDKRPSLDTGDQDRPISLDPPLITTTASTPGRRQSQHYSSSSTSTKAAPEPSPTVVKTPSKKWSFNALSLKLSNSPSSSNGSKPNSFPLSPRAVTFGQQLRKSTSKDQGLTPGSLPSNKGSWSSQPDAMRSAASITSLSSVGSVRTSKTPDRTNDPSRSDTQSSDHTTFGAFSTSNSAHGPLSPGSSIRRNQSKRLTPSSIPFFTRRSSSQSMQVPPSHPSSSSPTLSTGLPSASQLKSPSPSQDYNPVSTPASAHKKSSVLSLGSLLKSSSRRSLHADSKEAAKDLQRLKDIAKDAEKEKARAELKQQKKDDKDRSESRISVLMGGRKRGKTLSSTDPKKPRSPVNLPPMQMAALEPATAQRVARLKASTTAPSSSPPSTPRTNSRLTSQTVSSMQKQSDASLRSTRNHLPTIAGSPSVGTNVAQPSKEPKDGPPISLMNSVLSNTKETPTKIPRIASRTSAVSSPPLKGSIRRTSTVTGANGASSLNGSPTGFATNEFGVIDSGDSQTPKNATSSTIKNNSSIRASPSTASTSRVPRQVSAGASNIASTLPRKANRESISFSGLRKASTSSVTSVPASDAGSSSTTHHRFSALSPSKGLKLLSPKLSLSSARLSNASSSQNIHQAIGSPSSSRQSLSTTPSPVPSSVDEEELLGDEEMMHYIRRQQAKKMASGATQEELDKLLEFPEPKPPAQPLVPQAILKGSQSQHLSDYEKKEILEYSYAYYLGARSKKIMASPDNSTNNYGYDDDRGDYLVIPKDHLAYRYEIIDTLGKGSFGQVLHCRDHCTGESVAIKIIRNKKRFHHQALVEVKILDNLRKWDAEEKHHVIKMTENFYFRNHLCIAMELLSINLYELIKANGFVGFTTALIRRFTSQMLMSLTLMRHHRIVHCDLKPENVLLRHPAKSGLKVIDFGSSCLEHEKIYTYIQSRFYRSPEVILGMNYHMAIDMWSLGCILAELFTGFPIFPGENEQEQLSCIMEVLGPPDKDFINRSSRKKLFFEPNGSPRPVVNSKGRRRKPGTKSIGQVLRCNDEEFVDFISKCLVWDPDKRLKPQTALRHPFVVAGRRPKPVAPQTTRSTLSSSTLGSRRKDMPDTPKKSQISGPTPLTARTSRTTVSGAVPITPSSSNQQASTIGSSSRSHRVSQPQSLGSYQSSRTLAGLPSSSK